MGHDNQTNYTYIVFTEGVSKNQDKNRNQTGYRGRYGKLGEK
jgi:hypothetical protein